MRRLRQELDRAKLVELARAGAGHRHVVAWKVAARVLRLIGLQPRTQPMRPQRSR
jgi:hypothetical protein